MTLPELTASIRALWEGLAGAPAEFAAAVKVTISPRSYLCPPGWTGIVVIEDAVIATAPDPETAQHAPERNDRL